MPSLHDLTKPVRVGIELAGSAWPHFGRPLALELVSRRPIRQILPGVYHWTALHPRTRMPVGSYFIEHARVVLDPTVPREGLEWFDGRESPEQVILTNRHHYRQSDRYAEAFGCRVRCCDAGLHEFQGDRSVEGFAFGEEPAPGVVAHELAAICPDDTALHIPESRALAFADGLTRPRGGGLAFVPGFLLGDDPGAVREGLRRSLRRLLDLDLDFDNLLFAHGEPMIGGGKSALLEFVE